MQYKRKTPKNKLITTQHSSSRVVTTNKTPSTMTK